MEILPVLKELVKENNPLAGIVSKLEIEDSKSETKNNKILIDIGRYLKMYISINNITEDQYKSFVETEYLRSKFGNTIATTSKLILTSTGNQLNEILHNEGQTLIADNDTVELKPTDIYFTKTYHPKCYINVREHSDQVVTLSTASSTSINDSTDHVPLSTANSGDSVSPQITDVREHSDQVVALSTASSTSINDSTDHVPLSTANSGDSVSPQIADSLTLTTLYDRHMHNKPVEAQISYMKNNIEDLVNAKISYADINKIPFSSFVDACKKMVARNKLFLTPFHTYYKILIQTAYQSEYLIMF